MPNEIGAGERLKRNRRLRLWGTIVLLAAGAAVTGFFVGFTEPDTGWFPVLQQRPAIALTGLAALLLLFAAGSWRFFRQVDEMDVADNLWASMLGLYVYAVLLPVWWALWKLDLVRAPDQWTIYAATMIAAGVVYCYLKIRRR